MPGSAPRESVEIGVLSDTHVENEASLHELMAVVGAHFAHVTHILHAGDILTTEVLDQLRKIAPVTAVCGNMDRGHDTESLPRRQLLDLSGFRIGLVHGSGPPNDLENRVRAEFDSADCVVYGHSHSAANKDLSGALLFNPGSPTDTRFTDRNSLGILNIGAKIIGRIIPL